MSESYLDLYSVYQGKMAEMTAGNPYYDFMYEAISSGHNNFSQFNRFFEKKIDVRWVEAIEKCIIPIDNILRNPRKFIVQEEEVVIIERAKKITTESIRHLAQHTNMISKVEDDGSVMPSKILNVFREESYEIYENRFLYTLIKQLEYFINVRYDVLANMSDDENLNSLKMESSVKKGNELITFKMEVATKYTSDEDADGKKEKSVMDRILRIKTLVDDFVHSNFMREMRKCVPVRPPIMRTNVILKDPNFNQCLGLWNFIHSYDDVGYEINLKESDDIVSDSYRDDLYGVMAYNYMLLKKNTDPESSYRGKLRKRKIKPKFIKRLAEELVLNYDLDEVEIRKVFIDEMKLAHKKKTQGEQKIREAIDRALAHENERKRLIEQKIKEEIERKKEIERRRIEREKARIAREKELERQRKERERARLKAKKEKEIALEKARREREKEKKPADINLLFIEEPEAHTHPQMQYVFIKNIKNLLKDGIQREDGEKRSLQYIITSHSSHIVADSDFDDVKYLKKVAGNSVEARNLKDLKEEYANDSKEYNFLTQYLTISRAEIFFAEKAILIEGDTERMLIPTMMRKIDFDEAALYKANGTADPYLPLLSQNISIVEVGAYSQIFDKFIGNKRITTTIISKVNRHIPDLLFLNLGKHFL